jgi:hypothetical protein
MAGKAAKEGRPESEDLRPPDQTEPLAEGGFVFHRPLVALAALVAGLVLVQVALGARVHVRVEGKTRTIFGATNPVLDGGPNALTALDSASVAGEFFYHVKQFTFGPFVDQIGRYAPAPGESAGWAFKLNGASPPVGADKVELKDGDSVLWYWAQFGESGGPPTLVLRRSGHCYSVLAQDDSGKTSVAGRAVLHVGSRRTVATRNGRACIRSHRGQLVRATMDGAVRSNALP